MNRPSSAARPTPVRSQPVDNAAPILPSGCHRRGGAWTLTPLLSLACVLLIAACGGAADPSHGGAAEISAAAIDRNVPAMRVSTDDPGAVVSLTNRPGSNDSAARPESAPAASTAAARFEQGRLHYESAHYRESWAGFAQLADEGCVEAARIALQMRQWSPQVYGTTFTAGPKQLERWRATLLRDAAQRSPKAGLPMPAKPPAARPGDPERELWRHHGVG